MQIGGLIPLRLKAENDYLILEKIRGETLLGKVLERIKGIKIVGPVIIAAAESGEKAPLEEVARRYEVKLVSGPDDDWERCAQIAQNENISVFAKFRGNAPLVDSDLTQALLDKHLEGGFDYSLGKGFPPGTLPEIINSSALLKTGGRGPVFFLKDSKNFKINCLESAYDLSRLNLHLSSPENLKLVLEIFRAFPDKVPEFNLLLKALPKILFGLTQSTEQVGERRRFNKILNDLELAVRADELLSFPPTLRLDAHNLCNIQCKTCFQRFKSLSSVEYSQVFGSSIMSQVENISLYFRGADNFYSKKALPLKEGTFGEIRSALFPWIEEVSYGVYGEPFLNKDLFQMVKTCKEEGLTVNILTNGTLLDEKAIKNTVELGVNRLSISFDGAREGTFEKIRHGANFVQVVEALEKFKAAREKKGNGKPSLGFDFTACKENVDELPEFVDLVSRLGGNSILVSNRYVADFMDPAESLYYYRERGRDSILKAREKARSLGVDFTLSPLIEWVVTGKIEKKCASPWTQVYVSSIGRVPLCGCSFMKPIGKIGERSFREIWNAPEFKVLRRSMDGKEEPYPECKACLVGHLCENTPDILAFMSECHVGK